MTIDNAIAAYIKEIADKLAPGTMALRKRILASLASHLAAQNLKEMGTVKFLHVSGWVAARDVADSTLNNELSHVGKFLRWAYNHEYTDRFIDAKELRSRVTYDAPEIVADAVVRDILARNTWSQAHILSVHLMALMGLRRAEVSSLVRWSWREQDRVLVIPKKTRERTKRHGRALPVGPMLAAMLNNHITEAGPFAMNTPLIPLSYASIGILTTKWKDRQQKAVTPQRLRQWFCATLQRHECPHYLTEKMMGHRLPGAAHHYTPYDPEQARKWVALVEDVAFSDSTPSPRPE